MEDEELNEEVMGDPDDVREEPGSDIQTTQDGGESAPEEPKLGVGYEEFDEMRQHVNILEDRISGLLDSISTMIESGATVVENSNSMTDSEDDKEEPYLYLEDLDYSL